MWNSHNSAPQSEHFLVAVLGQARPTASAGFLTSTISQRAGMNASILRYEIALRCQSAIIRFNSRTYESGGVMAIPQDVQCAETPDARKSPAQSPIEKLLVTGLLSVINPLHHPHSKDHGI